jgi:hypothetical protein
MCTKNWNPEAKQEPRVSPRTYILAGILPRHRHAAAATSSIYTRQPDIDATFPSGCVMQAHRRQKKGALEQMSWPPALSTRAFGWGSYLIEPSIQPDDMINSPRFLARTVPFHESAKRLWDLYFLRGKTMFRSGSFVTSRKEGGVSSFVKY